MEKGNGEFGEGEREIMWRPNSIIVRKMVGDRRMRCNCTRRTKGRKRKKVKGKRKNQITGKEERTFSGESRRALGTVQGPSCENRGKMVLITNVKRKPTLEKKNLKGPRMEKGRGPQTRVEVEQSQMVRRRKANRPHREAALGEARPHP